MSKKASGQMAYSVYAAAVGGTTFDNRPLPTFEQLGERQQQAWQTVAEQGGQPTPIGQYVRDSKYGVAGLVQSITINKDKLVGVWLTCQDNTGRPFEHHADIDDLGMPIPA